MTTLDRMFFAGFVRNFAIVLVSLVGLYLVVDMFMNLNDFTRGKNGILGVLSHVGGYYGAQLALIFDRLGELITLAAAVFTAAWMQRNNELLPQLSAGVPTRRVIRPILFGVFLSAILTPLKTEFYIPAVSEELAMARDDPDHMRLFGLLGDKWIAEQQTGPKDESRQRKNFQVKGSYDSSKALFSGDSAIPPVSKAGRNGAAPRLEDRGTIRNFEYTSSSDRGNEMIHINAELAFYIPANDPAEPRNGGWKLTNAKPVEPLAKLPPNVVSEGPGRYFIKTDELDFETITRRHSGQQFARTPELWSELNKTDSGNTGKQIQAVQFHMRLVRPVTAVLLAVLGLSVILKDQNRHVFISAGLCLIMAAAFNGCVLGAKLLGDSEIIPAAVAAWVPVLVFGPIAFALFDAIHT